MTFHCSGVFLMIHGELTSSWWGSQSLFEDPGHCGLFFVCAKRAHSGALKSFVLLLDVECPQREKPFGKDRHGERGRQNKRLSSFTKCWQTGTARKSVKIKHVRLNIYTLSAWELAFLPEVAVFRGPVFYSLQESRSPSELWALSDYSSF